MLDDSALEQTAAQLAEFTFNNAKQQALLSNVFEKYNELLNSYQRLKSDYEEERDARERYKQLARGQDRNPFVLVIVDGDGYAFNDELISHGSEGGAQTARQLQNAVKQCLQAQDLRGCRIVTRIYCNLAVLSQNLAKVKLSGPEKRSLAPFVASFNQADDLSDFVDAGNWTGSVKSKVSATLRLYTDNPQCKHIFFAGCHDPNYILQLKSYIGQRNRLTLVKASTYNAQFDCLKLTVASFPEVFGKSSLNVAMSQLLEDGTDSKSNSRDTNFPVCDFFLRDACNKGNKCKFRHVYEEDLIDNQVDQSSQAPHPASASSGADTQCAASRENSQYETSEVSQYQAAGKQSDVINNHASHPISSIAPAQSHKSLTREFPRSEEVPPGMIPINSSDHRLDFLLQPLSSQDVAEFKARISKQKFCNDYHLSGDCKNGRSCPFDHTHLSDNMHNTLKTFAMSRPCPRRGDCRHTRCQYGHLCQKPDCSKQGGQNKTPLPGTDLQEQCRLSIADAASRAEAPTPAPSRGPENEASLLDFDDEITGQELVQTDPETHSNE